jgi:hypothetical protein
MNETDWLHARNPSGLLSYLAGFPTSRRKLRLFSCACCRRIWRYFTPELWRRAVGAAEAFADGRVEAAVIQALRMPLLAPAPRRVVPADRDVWIEPIHWREPVVPPEPFGMRNLTETYAGAAVGWTLWLSDMCEASALEAAGVVADYAAKASKRKQEARYQCALLRDIVGNPLRAVTVNREWLSNTVVAVGEAIYEDRAFDELPILADALEDAGCDNADILDHCRRPGEHVLGCWVIDLILGKS